VVIVCDGERLSFMPHALAVLDAFAQPRTVASVLETAASGPEHWIQLSSTVVQLARAGVLVTPEEHAQTRVAALGFARPSIHIAMLDDEKRTTGFLQALRATLTSTDVVVDIGTGTGILATGAALAGARCVYAVESSDVGESAEKVFAANGVADRVTLVRGRSNAVTLPERASVLVTEIIGNDPLDENILETVDDAKRRLLTPDARLIPSHLEIFAVPLEIPASTFERHVFTPQRISAWRAKYGVDLSPLASVRLSASQAISLKMADFLAWNRAAAPVSLLSIDLTKPYDPVIHRRASFVLERDVEYLGVTLAFRATLAPGIFLSTLAADVTTSNSWRYSLWPAIEPNRFERGRTVHVDYEYDRGTSRLSFEG
jgi:protein arginine N-methyltransferase 1